MKHFNAGRNNFLIFEQPRPAGRRLGISTQGLKSLAQADFIKSIQLKQDGGGSTGSGQSHDHPRFQSEMFRPQIAARVVKKRRLASGRIYRSEIRPLKKIAIAARQRQIVQHRLAAVLNSNDVVRLVRNNGILFVQSAVLAKPARPLPVGSP